MCVFFLGALWPAGRLLAMLRPQEPTVSTLHLVANDMTDIMENLDTRELDIGDGEEEFDGQDPNSTGQRNAEQHNNTNEGEESPEDIIGIYAFCCCCCFGKF